MATSRNPQKPMEGGGTPCVVHSDHLHGLRGHLHKPMVGGGTPCIVHGDHLHGLRGHLHQPPETHERRKDTARRAQWSLPWPVWPPFLKPPAAQDPPEPKICMDKIQSQ